MAGSKKTRAGRGSKEKKVDVRGKMPPPLKPKKKKKKAKDDKNAFDRKKGPKGGRSKGKAPAKTDKAPKKADKPAKTAERAKERPNKPRPAPKPPIEPDVNSPEGFRCGYVAIVGRPNVGKSTILNRLLGTKIAATSHKPQTTRRNLLGVLNPKGAQVLLLDTPGHHRAKGPLNRYMVHQVRSAIRDADAVAYVIEAREDDRITPGNKRVVEEIKQSHRPVVLLINKIDTLKKKENLLPLMERYRVEFGEQLMDIVPVSALKTNGLDRAVVALALSLPVGPALLDDGLITDASERAIVAELVREKLILETREELPYAAAITIEAFDDERPRIVRISAVVHVERPSQKAIVIGKGGARLKSIGQRARKDIEFFLDCKVFLEMHVRTNTRWTERPNAMADLGYAEGQ